MGGKAGDAYGERRYAIIHVILQATLLSRIALACYRLFSGFRQTSVTSPVRRHDAGSAVMAVILLLQLHL